MGFKNSSLQVTCYPLMHLCSYGSLWDFTVQCETFLDGKFIPVKNKKQLMYEQKNTNGEWDLVTNIEGHTSWYRQNRLLHRILIYQYFFFIENLVRLEVNRFIFRAIVSIPTAYLIQRIKNWHLIGTANQSVWHPSSALSFALLSVLWMWWEFPWILCTVYRIHKIIFLIKF